MKQLINAFVTWLKTVKPIYGFLFILFLMALIYDYPSILVKRPQSVHHWRQSDCASMTLNYYQTGMHFFQPQTHNLTSSGFTRGNVATSEIPIGYYFIAILYKIFGYHDFIYRFVNTLIFLTGLLFLFKTLSLLIKGFFWPAFLSLFFFTSPVLVYYGNNFITDSSALAFALIGWYFFIKYYKTGVQKVYYLSMFFFFLAGAYKITALMSLVAIFTMFCLEITGIMKFKKDGRLFNKPFFQAIPFLVIITVIGAWTLYAKHYNQVYGTKYFSTGIFPIWDIDKEQIHAILKSVKVLWLNDYFHVSSLYLLAGLFVLNLVLIKKANKLLLFATIMLFVGTIIYVILWFQTFSEHDYYTINLYILLILNVIAFSYVFHQHYSVGFNSKYVKILFFLFFIFNVVHAQKQMHTRYYGWWTEHQDYKDYDTVSPYLRTLGIQPLDTVICLPDVSHFTLYLMNQRGWTECMGRNRDSAGIATSIEYGAKYLIVNGNEIISRNYIRSFLSHPLGQYGNIRIFKLNKGENKVIRSTKTSTIAEKLNCGAEKISDDKKFSNAHPTDIKIEGDDLSITRTRYTHQLHAKNL